MLDKNGREIRTGDIVQVSGAYFKNSNGLFLVTSAEDTPNYTEYRRIFKIAELKRESWLARHMVADNKKATGCMNALKQMENGGYQDKNIQQGDRTLKIKVDGIGGGMNAMK